MKSFNTREISHRTCHIIRDERLSRELTQIEMANDWEFLSLLFQRSKT